ncbi:hypothetical protein TNCV_4482871 [Trichonephila clavipes]|nr:hypothetical protein TNCV_4482871 [Trichonephila clavipes]
MPTVPLYGSSEELYKTNRSAYCQKGVLLLHDNSSPHTFRKTRELMESFGTEVLDHAPYSPDLVQSDFNLFRYIKHSLGGKCFSDLAVRPGGRLL